MKTKRFPSAYIWVVAWLIGWLGLSIFSSVFMHSSEHALDAALRGPVQIPPFGTDAFGRELLWLIPASAWVSLLFAALAAVGALMLASFLGSCFVVAPPKIRFLFERGLDFLLAFPSLLLALSWAAIHGPGWDTLTVALLVGAVPSHIRLVYSRGREILKEDYLLAAVASGADFPRLIVRYLFPEMFRTAAIKLPNVFAHALIAEATLTYMGIGAPMGRDTWGTLLVQGKDYLLESPHIALWSGLPLVFTLLAVMGLMPENRLQLSASQSAGKSVP